MNIALSPELVFSFLVMSTLLVGILKADTLPQWTNGLIGYGVIAIMALITVITQNKITGNWVADWLAFAAAYSIIINGCGSELLEYLQTNISLPLTKKVVASPNENQNKNPKNSVQKEN